MATILYDQKTGEEVRVNDATRVAGMLKNGYGVKLPGQGDPIPSKQTLTREDLAGLDEVQLVLLAKKHLDLTLDSRKTRVELSTAILDAIG